MTLAQLRWLVDGLTYRRPPRQNKAMPSIPPPNDLQQIKAQLEQVGAKVDHLITVVETRKALVEGFDDRVARLDVLEKKLGTTALSLMGARMFSGPLAGAIAGAVVAAIVAWSLLSSVACAH
jgi:hypothetical protein